MAEEIVAWAQRKHRALRDVTPYASLDRLPTSTGPNPELWIQLDLKFPEAIGWTVSLTATGKIAVQFQYMKTPPFDSIEARRQLRDALVAIPGVTLEDNLGGRPSFMMASLTAGHAVERFLAVLEDVVDRIVAARRDG